jgi:hypothetical protein
MVAAEPLEKAMEVARLVAVTAVAAVLFLGGVTAVALLGAHMVTGSTFGSATLYVFAASSIAGLLATFVWPSSRF